MTVDVSIIIPVYNSWNLTEGCLTSLRTSLHDIAIETIVVDNGSFDETAAKLPSFEWIKTVRHARNLGFARACNAGAQHARGRMLLFLNNDTFVLPRSIDRMLASYRASPSIGILGARLMFSDYTIQHAGMAMDAAMDWHHVFRGLPAEHPLVLVKRSFQSVTGACLMIERELFATLNGFDEEYLNSHEDVDLCLRTRAHGREVVYDPSVVLFHYESMSAGRTLAAARGAELFRKKWGEGGAPDLTEKTVVFAQKLIAGIDAELRSLLDSERSPFRTPYDLWDDEPHARRYRELVRTRALCEPFAHEDRSVRRKMIRVGQSLRRRLRL